MSEIINPHDKFFRETFTRKEVAAGFLESYLPLNISDNIDFTSLKLVKESFVDKELKEHFSDILYTVSYNNSSLFLYILFEHKSYNDRFVGLQILRYMVKIWELSLKQNNKATLVSPILPLVLYHGKEKWQVSPNFQEIIKPIDKELCSFTPSFEYLLYDISHHKDDEIRGKVLSRIILLILKYINRPDLDEKLPSILKLLHDVIQKQTGLETLEVILRYVVQATKRFDKEHIHTLLEETFTKGDIMQTFIDKYIEQGMQQGMQQGIQEGIQLGMLEDAREMLIDVLEETFTSVPADIIELIHSIKDRQKLKQLLKFALRCESIDDFQSKIILVN